MLRQPIYKLIENNKIKINWQTFCANTDEVGIIIIEQMLNNEELFNNPDIWAGLSNNPNAIHILEKNKDKICWFYLSYNTKAGHILEENIDKIEWPALSTNSGALSILEKYPNKIHYTFLCNNKNKRAMELIKNNENKLYKEDWHSLTGNPVAVELLEKRTNYNNPSVWFYLSENPNAIHIIENHIDMVNWYYLSGNPNAIHILEKNIDKVDWYYLSGNPNGVHLIEKYLEKIKDNQYLKKYILERLIYNPNGVKLIEKYMNEIQNYDKFYSLGASKNPNAKHLLFTWDFEEMKKQNELFNYELTKYVFKPYRLLKISDKYNIPFDKLLEIY